MRVRGLKRLFTITGLSIAGLLLLAGPAAANAPWWHLTSGSRPTNLKSGAGHNEVQEVKTKATEGEFALVEEAKFEIAFLPWNATAAQVEAGLQTIYGTGNVAVSGGVEEPGHTRTYLVEFTGALADQPVAPMLAFSFSLEVEGSPGEASLSEKVRGAADGQIVLSVANLGDAAVDGETTPVTIADTLPAGLKAVAIQAHSGGAGYFERGPVKCEKATLTCSFEGTLPPFDQIEVTIAVRVSEAAQAGEANRLVVSGGESPPAQISRPIAVSGEPTPFGIEGYELSNEEEGGASATHAGSHPFQQTTTIDLNQVIQPRSDDPTRPAPAALPKDVGFHWPAGLFGNPTPIARCTLGQFLTKIRAELNACPAASAVGISMVTINETTVLGPGAETITVPIFNLEPAFGEPARLGFYIPITGTPVLIEPAVRDGRGGDYGLDVSSPNISQGVNFLADKAIVWGVPGDPRHDASRGWNCLNESLGALNGEPCEKQANPHPAAFLTMPTACSGASLQTSVQADSWLHSGLFTEPLASDPVLPALDGCNQLPFSPTIKSEPTSNAATSPTGLKFDINVKDEGLTNAEGLAQSQIRKAVVTLPEGFTANPSLAEGLKACSEAEYEASSLEVGSGCSGESRVGDVEVTSPLVQPNQTLTGGLFVARQHENPNHNLLTLYLIARDAEIGVIVKQALKVTPNPVTGQLTTEVDNIPQLPFSHFHLSFRQGQRSPLITPPTCGTYTVKALLYPWSNPSEPTPEEKSFQITQGPEGGPCPNGVPPFHPNLLAGSENPTAGAYSPFYANITRKDSEQEITHFSIKLPPGVVGKLAGIPFCPETGILQAEEREHEGGGGEELTSPSCPQASEIGHTNVGTGVGNVLAYAPGKLYLAGPYKGSQLSIVSITAAKVGPFDLGTVVVREALKVNPETAEVFVDATGSDPIPHIVDGIPVHLRDIQAFVDRPEFTLNPTSCDKTSTASTVLGSGLNFASEADDVPVTVTSPFQVGSCASLPFGPALKLKLLGATKRTGHPALKATLNMNGIGEAAIARSQVTLPKSEFLDQGHIRTVCTRVQFKEGAGNGAQCPPGSIYGHARATTPILSEPLEGPVFLRSSEHHLPDLVAALHGQEINVDLVGRIDSLHGQIRNTFEAVPDAPVSSFTLEMQGGAKGLLINSTNLCAGTHRAIVDFTGHNGKLHDFNPAVGAKCAKGHKHKSHKRHRAKRRH